MSETWSETRAAWQRLKVALGAFVDALRERLALELIILAARVHARTLGRVVMQAVAEIDAEPAA